MPSRYQTTFLNIKGTATYLSESDQDLPKLGRQEIKQAPFISYTVLIQNALRRLALVLSMNLYNRTNF
jgi:hypothetical protein